MKYLKTTFLLILGLLLAREAQLQETGFIYQSNDNGANWSLVTGGVPSDAIINDVIRDRERILAATNDHGLFASDDGLNWEPIGKNLPAKLKALTSNGNTLYAAPWKAGIMVSTDGGRKWQERNLGLFDREVLSLATCDNLVFAGTSGGVYVTWNDGATWMKVMADVQINDLAVVGSSVYAASPIGVFMSGDHGKTWKNILPKQEVWTLNSFKDEVYAKTVHRGILSIKNEATTWTSHNNGLPDGGRTSFGMIASDGKSRWVSDRGNLYRMRSGMEVWEPVAAPWDDRIGVSRIFSLGQGVILVIMNGLC